ncbi:Cyclin-D5-1 like [Heracleum sosnowskyi]|uniref:Cyclin-D5-1 like n=1 Tax=Heracleum sosnowskyi TaxID=360622 RepID=A0AAD8IUF4_9APIA|nr:Cyclin-D5-1 like [Heracleum sosnowskyi]
MVDSDSFVSTLDQISSSDDEKEGEEEEDMYMFGYPCDEDDNEDEYIQVLLRRELTSQSSLLISSGDWIMSARLDSIKWIFKAVTCMKFQLHTAYLSVTYFDKFLSLRMIDNEKYWVVRLLSVACLSLAAKMEECKVPSLAEFPMEDYIFESKTIQRMELLVLNTFEWQVNLITPFHYLHHFISKFRNKNQPRNVVPVHLIFAIVKDVNLMNQRSSVIAAAATLLAFDQKLTRQGLETSINTFAYGILDIEDVFGCYNHMQEISADETLYNPVSSLTPIRLIEPNVYGISLVTSAINTKRKRLEFNECDQDFDMPVEKRRR